MTRAEQVMEVLMRHIGDRNEYERPFETTQDGLGEAIGITRGHVSIVVKKLQERNMVTYDSCWAPKDDRRPRFKQRCYRILPKGIEHMKELSKRESENREAM